MTIQRSEIETGTGKMQPFSRLSPRKFQKPGNFPPMPPGWIADNAGMSQTHKSRGRILVDRLERRLEVTDQKAHAASLTATGKPDTIRDILRSKSGTVRSDTLAALADALECDPEYLTGEQDSPRERRDPEPGSRIGTFELSPKEIELVGLFRAAPQEQDRVIMIMRTLVNAVDAGKRVDERGRKSA